MAQSVKYNAKSSPIPVMGQTPTTNFQQQHQQAASARVQPNSPIPKIFCKFHASLGRVFSHSNAACMHPATP